MADRALRHDAPVREVVDLEKDERWQARLAEARARRAVALREKAGAEQVPKRRPKPWELEDQVTDDLAPVELPEEAEERLDFSDRVESLRKDTVQPGSNGGPSLGMVAQPKEADLEAGLDPAEPPKAREKVSDKYINALAPDFKPVRPFVPDPEWGATYDDEPERRSGSGEEDVSRIARDYAATMEPDASIAPPRESLPATADVRRRTRASGLLLAGICAMALLPLTETVQPIVKGPYVSSNAGAFGLEPALGLPRPMNVLPRTTASWEWVPELNRATDGPLRKAVNMAPQKMQALGALPPVEADGEGLTFSRPASDSVDTSNGRRAPALPEASVEAGPVDATGRAPTQETRAEVTLNDVAAPAPRQRFEAPLSVLRVTVLLPSGADPAVAETVASEVLARGHDLARVKPVDLKISARNVRFFHAEDRKEAARLAEGLNARLRDFTSFRPAPNEGTVEVWLAGEASASEPAVERREPVVLEPEFIRTAPTVIIIKRRQSFFERLGSALNGSHAVSGEPASALRSGSGHVISGTTAVPGVPTGSGGSSVTSPSAPTTATTGPTTGVTSSTTTSSSSGKSSKGKGKSGG